MPEVLTDFTGALYHGPMALEILDYKTSILNPVLKLLVAAVFFVGAGFFLSIRNRYEGEIGKVVRRLALAGVVGGLGSLFRQGADMWFSSMKWGESLFMLVFALINVYAIWPLIVFLRELSPGDRK